MDKNYRILRLINGTTIVGNVYRGHDNLIVDNPLEVITREIENDGGKYIGEQMNFRPFMIMTDDKNVTINNNNILLDYSLSPRLHNSYSEMVSSVYKQEIVYDGNFISKEKELDELEQELENLSDDTLKDLEEFLEEFLMPNKTLH